MPMRDYSLVGPESEKAVAKGLATGEWYRTDIPRKQMKELMQRSDGPAIRDTILWFVLFAAFGYGGYYFWGTWCVRAVLLLLRRALRLVERQPLA